MVNILRNQNACVRQSGFVESEREICLQVLLFPVSRCFRSLPIWDQCWGQMVRPRERIWARTALMEISGKWWKYPQQQCKYNFIWGCKLPKLLHKSVCCLLLQNILHFVWVSSKKCVVIVQRLGSRGGVDRSLLLSKTSLLFAVCSAVKPGFCFCVATFFSRLNEIRSKG